jgi:hypothetical protein
METTRFSETCTRLHGVTSQNLFQNVSTDTASCDMSVHLTHIRLKTPQCKQNICVRCRGKNSLSCAQLQCLLTAQFILHALSLCSCFCLPTVGSSEPVYFQHSVLSRRIKTNFHSTGLRLGQNGYHVLTPEGRGEIV